MRPQDPQGRLKALPSSDHWVFQATRPPTPQAVMGPERLGPGPLEPLTLNMLTGPQDRAVPAPQNGAGTE